MVRYVSRMSSNSYNFEIFLLCGVLALFWRSHECRGFSFFRGGNLEEAERRRTPFAPIPMMNTINLRFKLVCVIDHFKMFPSKVFGIKIVVVNSKGSTENLDFFAVAFMA